MFFKKKKNKDFYNKIIETTKKHAGDNIAKNVNKIKDSIMWAALDGKSSLHEYIYASIEECEAIKEEIRKLGFKVEESIIKDIFISWEDGVKAEYKPKNTTDYFIVLEDAEGCDPKAHALCTTLEKANTIKNNIVEEMTEECFEIDPEESGLDRSTDYKQIKRECEEQIKIIKISKLDAIIEGETNEI